MSQYSQKRKYESLNNDYNKRSKPENALIKRVQSQSGVRGKLVLVYSENESPFIVLQAAADAQKILLTVTAVTSPPPCIFELKLDNELIVRGEFINVSSARMELSRLAIKSLQYTCFSIIRKQNPEEITKVGLTPEVFEGSSNSGKSKFDANSESMKNNIGARMMKLMGWTGGGLGSQEQGDKNLVVPMGQNDRRGLGRKLPPEIKKLLEEYSRNDEIDSLAFSDKFTKEQRAFIHALATRFNLKSKSYGRSTSRVLVIRKKFTPWDLVHRLLEVGGETVEYKLVLPLNEESIEGGDR